MVVATDLSPKGLLSKMIETQTSGCCEFRSDNIVWQIFLDQGVLRYVDCSSQELSQLEYYLFCLGYKKALAALKTLPSEVLEMEIFEAKQQISENCIYQKVVTWLVEMQYLQPPEASQLLLTITRDNIQYCLWSEQLETKWIEGKTLPAWIGEVLDNLPSLNFSECIKEVETKIRQWQNFTKELVSVHQRPYFPARWEARTMPSEGVLNIQALTELTKVLRGRTSIRQLSMLLKNDEIQVASVLSPYIRDKIIYLRNGSVDLQDLPTIPRGSGNKSSTSASPAFHNSSGKTDTKNGQRIYRIVCIDDSPTILSEIKRFLDQDNFAITLIDDPIQAVSKVFTIKPDLILLDITMPKINGYKLCGLLRNSGKCNDVPIIMVTGNTGLIDKARAKLSGCSDYLAKPFSKEGLNQIVAKHLLKP